MLSKQNRLRKQKDFDFVFKKGHSFFLKEFRLRIVQNGNSKSRFAFVVSVKTMKRAVDRNRIRRQLSEIIRLFLANIKDGYDVVFLINKDALKKPYQELQKSVFQLLTKAHLLYNEENAKN